MKAITICQPYAQLICVTKQKRVENRTWSTSYRGTILIHAGKSRDWLFGDEQLGDEADAIALGKPLVFGAIIGAAKLVACARSEDIEAGKLDDRFPGLSTHTHVSGPWCWVLVSRVAFPQPILCRGAQGLFNVPDELVAAQIAAVRAADAARRQAVSG